MNRFFTLRASRNEIVAFAVGMVILAFELTAARIVAPYLGDTIYTWTSIIGVILAAMAFGYARGGILADSRQKISDVVLLLLAAAVAITLVNIFKDPIINGISHNGWPLQFQAFTVSLALFALPTFLLGATAPYLARLSITDLETSGQRLSRVDAAGTIGSLVGTFLTGYVLFSLIGSRNLLTLLAVITILASFLITQRKILVWQLGLLAVVILCGLFSSRPPLSGFVSEIDSAYSRYIIRDISYDGQPARVLQTDENGLQSGIYLNDGSNEVFSYIRGFSYASHIRPDADEFLIVGGGAFTFPEALARQRPQATVDTVEIDSRLPQVSRQYFDFRQPDNLNIITADGRQFLNGNQKKYDMIYLDAFTSIVPPFQLMTQEAVAAMDESLEDDGIVAANVIAAPQGSRAELIMRFYSTLRTKFPYVSVYQVNPAVTPDARQNLLALASNQPIDQDILNAIGTDYPEFSTMLATKLQLDEAEDSVLSDDYAPVEQMSLW